MTVYQIADLLAYENSLTTTERASLQQTIASGASLGSIAGAIQMLIARRAV